MILPNSYETILDKIKQDWFNAGWKAATEEHEAWLARDYENRSGYYVPASDSGQYIHGVGGDLNADQ